ncbi:GDP-L-fucose synthase family protein [Streptomyces sp. NPDC088350]|uniref:GDP-L-fucose synthase family protein n=1 Tax=Streptomyces sp. NPDC088350 TaxID=3365854 RepID=UPI00381B8F0C
MVAELSGHTSPVSEVVFPLAGRRVWVAGHGGMVGSALVRRLAESDVELVTASRGELDLRNSDATLRWVKDTAPDMIFIAAGRVGGIDANSRFPADFIADNLAINMSVISAAVRTDVPKLMVLGSSCIYPKHAAQPMRESSLLTGAIEPTNVWYAMAKISAIKLAEAYRIQYGHDFISAMPTSLFGPNDNFDEGRGHVIPALMSKARDAVASGAESLEVWGSGTPLREFLHVDDCADALVHLAERYSDTETVNVGSGSEISIRELAEKICTIAGFDGELRFDPSRPDGAPRKWVDSSRIRAMGWVPRVDFDGGLRDSYERFLTTSSGAPRGSGGRVG